MISTGSALLVKAILSEDIVPVMVITVNIKADINFRAVVFMVFMDKLV